MIYEPVFQGSILRLERGWKASPESIGLLLPCKQLSTEAIDASYRNVVIEVDHSFPDLDTWVCQVPLKYLQQIVKIRKIFRLPSWRFFEASCYDRTGFANWQNLTSTGTWATLTVFKFQTVVS
jgi:hypothetical protein